MRAMYAILKQYFRERPSFEDFVAAHNPTSIAQLEYLEREYRRFMLSKNFWGESF